MSPFYSYSQISPAELRANWIYNIIAQNIIFEDEESIEKYKIAVFGKEPAVKPHLYKFSATQTIKGKPSEIYHFKRINQIEETHILFVEEKKNDLIKSIFNKIKGTGTLLITYNCEDSAFIMINLILKGWKNQFEINSNNLHDEKIKATDKLMRLGGTRVDLQGLVEKKEKELNIKEQQLKEQEKLLNKKEKDLKNLQVEIEKQKKLNLTQKKENENQSELLKNKEKELNIQKQKANELLSEVNLQKRILSKNRKILKKEQIENLAKQNYIDDQNIELDKKANEIENKEKELTKQQKEINEQKKVLSQQTSQISTQKNIIFAIIFIVLSLLVFAFFIYRAYKANRKMNKELKQKNIEINKQKDEITTQSKQLEQINTELEKLSIVASQTDNAVIIMDSKGNFEWINAGFTRLYGYTLQLLKNELDENIINVSSHSNIKEIITRCVAKKETITYETVNVARDNNKIWVQTTLTPILDNNKNVTKLIAIETNINTLKLQEKEIRQKSEELIQQKDELQEQNIFIEEQNKHIRSSIGYAKTIQNSILPIQTKIQQAFNSFVIFRPKDIVSGDFYWYIEIKPNKVSENLIRFFAAVDCTGHGVPGAFMSLISSRLLNEIVINKKITTPKEILEELNNSIIETLKQKETDNNDGMDLCLIRIDEKVNDKNNDKKPYKVSKDLIRFNVTFSGAKRPLFYYAKQENKFGILKSDRKSIGGVRARKSKIIFTNQTLTLYSNDVIYLTTDGLIDQNNYERKRFGTPKFTALLDKIKDKSIPKQKQLIENELDNYQQHEAQRDDITVLGLQFK